MPSSDGKSSDRISPLLPLLLLVAFSAVRSVAFTFAPLFVFVFASFFFFSIFFAKEQKILTAIINRYLLPLS